MARIRSVPPNEWKAASTWAGQHRQVYVIREEGGPCKIGYSRNAFWRLTELQVGNPRKLRVFFVWECDRPTAIMVEGAALIKFEKHIVRGEWIDADKDDIATFINGTFV